MAPLEQVPYSAILMQALSRAEEDYRRAKYNLQSARSLLASVPGEFEFDGIAMVLRNTVSEFESTLESKIEELQAIQEEVQSYALRSPESKG